LAHDIARHGRVVARDLRFELHSVHGYPLRGRGSRHAADYVEFLDVVDPLPSEGRASRGNDLPEVDTTGSHFCTRTVPSGSHRCRSSRITSLPVMRNITTFQMRKEIGRASCR